ncbi:MAG: hypothetical protein ACP5O6_10220 [Candidatus Baltobacteraceae bacterium]
MRLQPGGVFQRAFESPASMEQSNAERRSNRPHAEAIDEPRWHASLAAIGALVLYVLLPQRLVFGPAWFAPIVVLAVLVPLSVFAPDRDDETRLHRVASIASIVLLNLFNVLSVLLLLIDAFSHHAKGAAGITGQRLLLSGAQIWTTNVLVYALWFWEVDGGGPWQRSQARNASADLRASFLFPQMMVDARRVRCVDPEWKPLFLDYLYVAFTNALAFSPTDTMPITRSAKMLMLVEASISFVTIALVVSRAINVI